jgi:hypothetical protein
MLSISRNIKTYSLSGKINAGPLHEWLLCLIELAGLYEMFNIYEIYKKKKKLTERGADHFELF